MEIRTTFAPFPASVGAARRFVRDILVTRCIHDDVVHTVELLTSELVTNAVIHAQSSPQLSVTLDEAVVRVEVCDGDSNPPTRRVPDMEAASGRGIAIVEELAVEWGVDLIPDDGKRVWFEVPR